MPTNLKIDDTLLDEAVQCGGFRTKKDAVNHALHEYVRQQKRVKLLELEGQIDFDKSYDYKAARNRKRL